ncbi:MAG: hypothetical protein EOO68_22710, partial [Moraxellaceae bacterium]
MIIAFLIVISAARSFAKNFEIQHLEPLHWWAGMHHPELQLMVHGKNIAELAPTISYTGVS